MLIFLFQGSFNKCPVIGEQQANDQRCCSQGLYMTQTSLDGGLWEMCEEDGINGIVLGDWLPMQAWLMDSIT